MYKFAPSGVVLLLAALVATPPASADAPPVPQPILGELVLYYGNPYAEIRLVHAGLTPAGLVIGLVQEDDPPTEFLGFGARTYHIDPFQRTRRWAEPSVDAYPAKPTFSPGLTAATDSVGNYQVVWVPISPEGATRLFSRRYAPDSTPLDAGAELFGLVPAGKRIAFRGMTLFDDGSHLLRWVVDGQLSQRLYLSTGVPAGPATPVNHPPGLRFSGPNGDFIVSWTETDAPGNPGLRIQAQRFHSDGTANGDAFQVNTNTTGDQRLTKIGTAQDGKFAAIWTRQVGDRRSAQLRRFDSSGSPVGPETEIAFDTARDALLYATSVGYYEADRLVVSWVHRPEGSDVSTLKARFVAQDGSFESDPVEITTHHQDRFVYNSFVKSLENGEFVIAWQDYDLYVTNASAQVFAPDGDDDDVSDLRDNCVGSWNPGQWDWDGDSLGDPCDLCEGDDATGDPDGDGVCSDRDCAPSDGTGAHLDGCGVCGGDNSTCSNEALIAGGAGDQNHPDIAAAPDGSFLVVWDSTAAVGDSDGKSVHGQRFSRGGEPDGAPFQLNSLTTGNQERVNVAFRGDGTFVAVWQSDFSSGDDSEGSSIQARAFGLDNNPLGPEQQVNTTVTGSQIFPRVAFNDGKFAVTWSETSDVSDSVEARLLDSDGNPLGMEWQLNTRGATEVYPKVYPRPAGGFTFAWTGGWTLPRHLRLRHFDSDAVPLGPELYFDHPVFPQEMDEHGPVLARHRSGELLLAWWDTNGDDFGTASWARRLDADGVALGASFRLHHHIGRNQLWPELLALGDTWVAVWQSQGGADDPAAPYRIMARHFEPDGTPTGQAYRISTGASIQRGARLIPMWDGGYTVVWVGTGADGMDVLMRRFRAPVLFGDGFESGDLRFWEAAQP